MKTLSRFLCRALVACGMAVPAFQAPVNAQTSVDLAVDVAGPTTAIIRTTADLTISVFNNGPGDATGVVVTFAVQKHAKVAISSPPCNLSHSAGGQRTVTCDLATIPSGMSASFQMGVSSNQTVTFLFTASSDGADSNPLNNAKPFTIHFQ